MTKIFMVIPAYNEEKGIKTLSTGLRFMSNQNGGLFMNVTELYVL